jgi:hypothetical protein
MRQFCQWHVTQQGELSGALQLAQLAATAIPLEAEQEPRAVQPSAVVGEAAIPSTSELGP